MNTITHDLFNFIQNLDNNSSTAIDIDIDDESYKTIKKYIAEGRGYYKNLIGLQLSMLQEGGGVGLAGLSENQQELLIIGGSELHWDRGEQISAEGTLAGGFYINGIVEMLLEPAKFWRNIADRFQEVGQEDRLEIPEGFSWFTGTHAVNSSRRRCHYGCVQPEQGKFPSEFFFYDSGLLFPLPFTSVEEYLRAMIASAAVECWQYFYIDPELVISKSKGLSYFTWALYLKTRLDNDLISMSYVENAPYDRLDMIAEYLERCVRILPDTFPFLDFEHHKNYYEGFMKLYQPQ